MRTRARAPSTRNAGIVAAWKRIGSISGSAGAEERRSRLDVGARFSRHEQVAERHDRLPRRRELCRVEQHVPVRVRALVGRRAVQQRSEREPETRGKGCRAERRSDRPAHAQRRPARGARAPRHEPTAHEHQPGREHADEQSDRVREPRRSHVAWPRATRSRSPTRAPRARRRGPRAPRSLLSVRPRSPGDAREWPRGRRRNASARAPACRCSRPRSGAPPSRSERARLPRVPPQVRGNPRARPRRRPATASR